MNVLYSNFEQFFPSIQENQVYPPKKMDIRNLLAPAIKEYKSFESDSKRAAPYPTRSRSTFTTLSSLRNSTGSMRSSSTTLSDDHSSVSSSFSSSHDAYGIKLSREIMDIAEVLEGMKKATVDSTPSISTSYEALPDTKSSSGLDSNSTPYDGLSKSSDSLRFCNRSFELKPKKRRRRREEIERKFLCPIKLCDKSYGSEGALKTHIKIKHKNLLKNHQDAKSLIDSFNAAANLESQSPQSPPGSSSGDDNASSDEEDFQSQSPIAINTNGMDTS